MIYRKVKRRFKQTDSVPAFSAQNALDRNVTTCTRTAIIGNTSPDKNVSWQVDLGGVYNIYSITILFKEYEGYG